MSTPVVPRDAPPGIMQGHLDRPSEITHDGIEGAHEFPSWAWRDASAAETGAIGAPECDFVEAVQYLARFLPGAENHVPPE